MNVIVPLNKKVIVEPESREKISKGGIVIPDVANQKAPTKGTVLAIAEDSDLRFKVQAGDIVLFSKFAGIELTLKSTEAGKPDRLLYCIKDDDILARVEVSE